MSTDASVNWQIPNRWAWCEFSDVAEIAQDLVDPSEVPDVPHIAPNHIESGTRRLLPYTTVREDGVTSPKQRFSKGQILFTKIRPYLLKSILANFDGVCSADMYPLWTKQTADPNYVLYWLTSHDFRDIIAFHQGRTVLPKINQPTLNGTPVPLPPLGEQRRIVAKINCLSGKSKRARDHLNQVQRLVKRYREAVLAAAFRGTLTREIRRDNEVVHPSGAAADHLPTGWRWSIIGDLASVTGGLTKNSKRTSLPVEVPYLRVANVYSNELRLDEIQRIRCSQRELDATALKEGDLLVVEGNGSIDQIGRVAIWNGSIESCSHQNHLIRVRAHDETPPRFILYWLLSPLGRAAIESVASSSSGLHTLSISKVSSIRIPICPHAESLEIIRRIETAFAWIDRLATEATSARKLIDNLNQAILSKAFRGELVPQDPNDEPASVLLGRISAMGEADGNKSKRRKRWSTTVEQTEGA